jgi:hypothetical protein
VDYRVTSKNIRGSDRYAIYRSSFFRSRSAHAARTIPGTHLIEEWMSEACHPSQFPSRWCCSDFILQISLGGEVMGKSD